MTYAQIAMTIVCAVLITLILFAACVGSAIRKRKNLSRGETVLNDYYAGGRTTGAFVLAMTILTTYLSVGSFLGGPGYAYEKGMAWTYLSVVQIPIIFLTFTVVGKKLGTVSRAIGGVTVSDVLRARYESAPLVIISAVLTIACFIVQMAAQIKGGAILFQTITGLNYERALLLFGVLVVLFTAIGGFAGQSIANTLFGILMIVGCVTLSTLLSRASSNGNIAETMSILHPGWDARSGADGSLTPPYMLSFLVLVGLGAIGLPQTAVCGTAYRDTKALNRAIPIGTILLAFVVLSLHIVGAYAPLLISMPEVNVLLGESAGTEYVIPGIVLKYMNPLAAGLFFVAPLAAALSSVNALLLSGSSALVKDIYVNYVLKDKARASEERFRKRVSFATLLLTAALVLAAWSILQLEPFRSATLVELNLAAMGGLECIFFFPLVGGLYWKRGTALGALLSCVTGIGIYAYLSFMDIRLFGFLPVVPALLAAGIVYLIVSKLGKPQPLPEAFFPKEEER